MYSKKRTKFFLIFDLKAYMKNEKLAFENFWHLPVYCLWNRKLLNVILILKFFWVTPSLDHLGSILYHSAPILKSGYIGQEICYSKILTADWTVTKRQTVSIQHGMASPKIQNNKFKNQNQNDRRCPNLELLLSTQFHADQNIPNEETIDNDMLSSNFHRGTRNQQHVQCWEWQ